MNYLICSNSCLLLTFLGVLISQALQPLYWLVGSPITTARSCRVARTDSSRNPERPAVATLEATCEQKLNRQTGCQSHLSSAEIVLPRTHLARRTAPRVIRPRSARLPGGNMLQPGYPNRRRVFPRSLVGPRPPEFRCCISVRVRQSCSSDRSIDGCQWFDFRANVCGTARYANATGYHI